MDKLGLTMLAPMAFALAALAAGAASAQGTASDRAYCNALADKYTYYVGHDLGSAPRTMNRGTTDAQVAVAQCREGRTESAIPVLERELTRARVALPGRG